MNCLQLDIARQKESLSFIDDYFKKAKNWGYDTVILYLENAVRTSVTANFSVDETYSKEEIGQIVGFGLKYGLRVIPAVENLGHLEKFFAYENWRNVAECQNEQIDGRGFDAEPYGSCGCPSSAKLYELTDTYIKEVVSLFPSEYVHAGLDEVFDMGVCDKCKERIQRGETKSDVFLKHVLHTYELLKSLGKQMMMWDDFFEYVDIVEKLPRDIILCNWNYGYIDYEPRGHWTNRIKKDWFRLYDKLGFRYLYCVYAHRASSLYNVKSFYRYASKHKPFGAICTTWCRQDSFYLGAYPFMSYCGSLWSGKTDDELAVFTEVLKDEKLARLFSSLYVVDTGRNTNVSKIAECRYLSLECYEAQLKNALSAIKDYAPAESETGDIICDIKDYITEIYCGLRLNAVANKAMDIYEAGGKTDALVAELNEISDKYKKIYKNKLILWKKYRGDIASEGNALSKKYTGIIKSIEEQAEILQKNEKRAVLTLEQMAYDAYGTPQCSIVVAYSTGEENVFSGALKPSTVAFEQSGCYYHRFAVKPEKIDHIILSFYGESASYPQYISYVLNGEKFLPETVAKVCGYVYNEQNLTKNDTRFAVFGSDDGQKHFDDITLAKEKNKVKITFKKL